MTYTICLDTMDGLKKYGEYPTENQARSHAISILKKNAVETGRTAVYIFKKEVWDQNRRNPDVPDLCIGWVQLPMPGTPKRSQQPLYDGAGFWRNRKGLFTGSVINADGSLGRPFKMTKSGEVKYTDVPKKKKKDTGMHPFGL